MPRARASPFRPSGARKPRSVTCRRRRNVCDARRQHGGQFGLRLPAVCKLFDADPIKSRVQHVGELPATIGDELSERLLFALKGVDSLAVLRGDELGLCARFVDQSAPFGFDVRAQPVKLVSKIGML